MLEHEDTSSVSDDSVSDDELMRRYQTTLDAAVFERLVERHWARGFAVAARLLNDRHSAEDALQEAFMRLLRRADRYDCEQSFASWFYVILRNTCLDMHRRRQSAPRLFDQEPDLRPSRLSEFDQERETKELLARLPAADRDVLVLRVVHGMPFSEVALALGCREEAARKRAQRALHRLRKDLAPARLLTV